MQHSDLQKAYDANVGDLNGHTGALTELEKMRRERKNDD
jgi:hypothetical protein